jgi:hypothetical protein
MGSVYAVASGGLDYAAPWEMAFLPNNNRRKADDAYRMRSTE